MFSREHAPISSAALDAIDAQAASTLRQSLSARRFVDVKGPMGWEFSGVPLGRFESLEVDGNVGFGVRRLVPVVETRADFSLSALELHLMDRGAVDPDLTAVEKAALELAAFEDRAVYSGFGKAGIKGLADMAENSAVSLPEDPQGLLYALAGEISRMKTASSIGGPYALAGGTALRAALGRIVGGKSLFEIIKKNSDIDEFIFTPSSDAALLVSKRGGDFELTVGGDFVVGYAGTDGKNLAFFLTESFTFRVIEPRAFTPLSVK
ncbi:MAG: bacteriocin family protein [Synergistaceae bacterium]|jgi:uncharacterized linocin/CFP29 family protein|nr:bacteriocin family protein [Synergistaceae bacterium]